MRRRAAVRREIIPDPVFKSKLVSRFISKIMLAGKRSIAARHFYQAMDILGGEDSAHEGFKKFEQAIENVKPALEVKSRRVGGSTYQVPIEVRGPRKLSLAMRWILGFSRARKEKSFALRLAAELGDAAKGLGSSIKKRDDVHRMAEANKAFSHYRW